MSGKRVDMARARGALLALDALVDLKPRLRGARARVRLGAALGLTPAAIGDTDPDTPTQGATLDVAKGVSERGGGHRDGDEEEDREG